MTLRYSSLISSALHSTYTIPQKWINDIKHIEFNELLSSSVGPLALFFGWKKKDKEELAELCASLGLAGAVGANPLLFKYRDKNLS